MSAIRQRTTRRSAAARAQAEAAENIGRGDDDSGEQRIQQPAPNTGDGSPRKKHLPLLERRNLKKGDPETELQVTLDEETGRVSLDAPQTPFHELDLSESFLAALHDAPFEPKHSWRQKRRSYFFLGGIIGCLLASWYFAADDPLATLQKFDLDSFTSWDLQSMLSDMPSLSNLNLTELVAPGRDWLNSRASNFEVGRDARDRGLRKKHAVVLVPGIISTGLESWSTQPDAAPFFRNRIWAGTSMVRALISNKDAWVRAISLDPFTGLDPKGYKKVIENLAVLDYDHDDLSLASYDWRLSFYNLEVRDRYFSRLKSTIEFNLANNEKKTVLVSHSMGGPLLLWFFKWVEAPEFGNGGTDWVERHIDGWVNVAGTMLGVPKAMSALLSGEMRDTVEINQAAVYLLERFFSRAERAKLFRSWAGSASMMLKGGNDVWGTSEGAPDDFNNSTLTGGNLYYFRPEAHVNTSEVTEETMHPNLTLNDALGFVLQKVPPSYQQMLATNYSLGIERDEEQLKRNNHDHTKWSNPLEVQLPRAPSMKIYCLYGTGKETERAYFYQQGGYEHDESPTVDLHGPAVFDEQGVCPEPNCSTTPRAPLDLPLQRKVWIDNSVTLDEKSTPKVRSGVVFGDGDGTVSTLSLGSMCVEGWKRPLYNPAGIEVVTHEILHSPQAFDPRGGPTTADHVDILGSSELNDAILEVVAGEGQNVKDQYHSRIRETVARINWDGRIP
ncbi:phospholipid:diacylglycerol acyltransferase [Rhodotorula sphaerocarpa]